VRPSRPGGEGEGAATRRVPATMMTKTSREPSDPRRVYHAPPAVYRPLDGGFFLVIDPEAPHWISVTDAGAEILRLADGRRTLAELSEILASRHGLEAAEARERAAAFLAEAAAAGFVSEKPRPVLPYPGRAAVIRPRLLAELFLFLTNDCNLRCTHCYVRSGEAVPAREMTGAEMREVIDQAKDLGARRFYFTGGEPFLCRDVFDLAERVTVDSDLVVLTNGILPEAVIDRLAGSGRGRLTLQISVDGPTKEAHERIRGTGTFEPTLRTIRALAAKGLAPVVTTAVAPHTLSSLDEQVRLAASLGVRELHLLFMQEWGRAADRPQDHRIDAAAAAARLREVRDLARSLGVVVDNEEAFRNRLRGPRGRKTDLCGCAYESLAVFSDGVVYPCVWLAGAPDWAAGPATEGRLERTFRESPVLGRLRALSVADREICSDCEYRFLCGGGNPCASYFESLARTGLGTTDSKEPFCAPHMALTESLLEEMAKPPAEAAAEGGFSPRVVAAMGADEAACSHPHTRSVNRAFDVATARCACVLRADAEEEVSRRSRIESPADVFDARGRACVELLVPLAARVRAMAPGARIDVLSDDPAARVDLPAWCRMTGNEIVATERAEAHTLFRLRRAERRARATDGDAPAPASAPAAPPDVTFDAGDMGCGELVLELKLRFAELPPRSRFDLLCTDPGADEDIPAWCRMTGHALVGSERLDGERRLFRIRTRE